MTELERWKAYIADAKASWILLHLFGDDPSATQHTLEDLGFNVGPVAANDAFREEINRRMAPISRPKRCKRCGKRWCGTSARLDKLYPEDAPHREMTYGSKKCRRKGPKR